ncbi:unnamed protein product [Clonostachys byssicola]|uniref:Carboxylesterase type B domain-containing protein n=1 Tax=Clonostachys byssicola TaxID=160290 RepID=A0A9N9U9I6_9HYPO|nr:unnamed protein product [Clonostachys byssicola]
MRSPFSLVTLGAFLGLTRALDLPIITLPWGKYQAEVLADDEEILLFKNVRFGMEPPRFGAPSFPDWKNDSIQSPNRDTTCFLLTLPLIGNPGQTEDCLFLDIYVPKRAFEEDKTALPVTVWISGGAYIMTVKTKGGKAALQASNYKSIFIEGNYRLGAFGWLAGDYMQQVGQPNAGLYDQALLFEWVQKYIDQVHGDKESVSAWGESAGAGSILHHLVREDGAVDPNFHTFAALSPAFEWAWDNSPGGRLDTIFRNLSYLAGCKDAYDIDCLRQAPVKDVASASTELYNSAFESGLLAFGPSTDGKWIKNLSPISFSEGKYWKNIKSSIISHVSNEAYVFKPRSVVDETTFDAFLNEFLPGPALAPQRVAIKKQYDCKEKWYDDYPLCVTAIISDAVFTCNTRDLATAYPGISYMMEFAFPVDWLAFHAVDVIFLFHSNAKKVGKILQGFLEKINIPLPKNQVEKAAGIVGDVIESLSRPYQKYFASFALSGDPNTLPQEVKWPPVKDDGDEFSDVLQVGFNWDTSNWGPSFKLVSDSENSKASCSFWTELAKEIVAAKTTYGASHGAPLEVQYPIDSGNEL